MPVESHPTQCKTSHMACTAHHPTISLVRSHTCKEPRHQSHLCNAAETKNRTLFAWASQQHHHAIKRKLNNQKRRMIQYSPTIMFAQELLFVSARRSSSFAGNWKLQEHLCGCMIKVQELLCSRIFELQELLRGSLQWQFERNETGYM